MRHHTCRRICKSISIGIFLYLKEENNMKSYETLEFNIILKQLEDLAFSEGAKEKIQNLQPILNERVVKARMDETTSAKRIVENLGNPPLSFMSGLKKILELSSDGAMLSPEQLSQVVEFINSCKKMTSYLKRAATFDETISQYGQSFFEINELVQEIENAIHNGRVNDEASSKLRDTRRKMIHAQDAIKLKLETLLRSKKDCLAEAFIVNRNGRLVLPVKRTHKSQINGTVIDVSSKGTTLFIEPNSVSKLQNELSLLEIEEDNEIRKVLYTLTALVEEQIPSLSVNIECMEVLDFVFAKAKLSIDMDANHVIVTPQRHIKIVQGRHPLIDKDVCVPLDFELGQDLNGIVITGPNTGGKTVTLKTVGLLSLMAQSGLHVPAKIGSVFTMNVNVLCDIGDGQSITENLSTFSAHIKNVVDIIEQVSHESLVLLDELGSGTDPGEGMGIAVAILEELRQKDCLFVATTHYPEVKDYAKNTPNLINASMGFDRENLVPLYQLHIGEAGQSCAFHIARRLGLPEHMLTRAHAATYKDEVADVKAEPVSKSKATSKIIKDVQTFKTNYQIGDSVTIFPEEILGIVYKLEDTSGNLVVHVRGEKRVINHKRLKLAIPASELYPEGYDLSIIFDTVEQRKTRHQEEKDAR